MSGTQIILCAVLAAFTALCGVAIYAHGYAGFFELATANWATRTLFADLVIALALTVVWMYRDARERGAAFAPFLVLTVLLGSVGPLLYLILRRQPEAARAAA
jgi:hypothetical protein